MGLSRRKFTREFKVAAVRRLETGLRLAEVARCCEVNPSVLQRWRREFREEPGKAFSGLGRRRAEESRVAELERKVGQQAMEMDFLKRALQRAEELRQLRGGSGGAPSTSRSRRN